MSTLADNINTAEAPPTEEILECPLCGSWELDFLFENVDRLHRLPGKFGMVRCKQCKLVRLSPRPLREFLGFYYPEGDYYSHSTNTKFSDAGPYSLKEQIRSSVFLQLGYQQKHLRKAFQFLGPLLYRVFLLQATYGAGAKFPHYVAGGRALDVGCGSGAFLATLKRHGWKVQGVDISELSAKRAKELLDVDVFAGNLEEAKFAGNSFDFISMNHSLEHLSDLNETLTELFRILKPGGVLYIEVPNVISKSCRTSKKYWFHWDSPRHLFAFSPTTLRQLLEKHDFRISRLETVRADYYAQDAIYKIEEENPKNPRKTLYFSELLKTKWLKIFTNIYYRFNRQSGDFITCWASKK